MLLAGATVTAPPAFACKNSSGVSIGDPPGDKTTPCSIGLGTAIVNEQATYRDNGAFRFNATKGTQYRIHALASTSYGFESSTFGVSLSILDQNGGRIVDRDVGSAPNDLVAPFTAPYTGTFYAVVSAGGLPYPSSRGYYTLAYSTTNPAATCAAGTVSGPNRGQAVGGNVSRNAKSPMYCFSVAKGSYFRFRLRQTWNENGGSVGYRVYGQQFGLKSSGRIGSVDAANGGVLDITVGPAPASATNYIQIDQNPWYSNSTGNAYGFLIVQLTHLAFSQA